MAYFIRFTLGLIVQHVQLIFHSYSDCYQEDGKNVDLQTVSMFSSVHPLSVDKTQASVVKNILVSFVLLFQYLQSCSFHHRLTSDEKIDFIWNVTKWQEGFDL